MTTTDTIAGSEIRVVTGAGEPTAVTYYDIVFDPGEPVDKTKIQAYLEAYGQYAAFSVQNDNLRAVGESKNGGLSGYNVHRLALPADFNLLTLWAHAASFPPILCIQPVADRIPCPRS